MAVTNTAVSNYLQRGIVPFFISVIKLKSVLTNDLPTLTQNKLIYNINR